MGGPPLVGWLVVLLGTATGVSCLLRTRAAVGLAPADRRVARAEGLKGLGMALMAVPAPALDQRPWGAPLFVVVFGAMTVWSVMPLRRGGHLAHHVHLAVGAAAMVYMALVTAAAPAGSMTSPGMAGMPSAQPGPAGIPLVSGLLMAYFASYALWAGIRMLPVSGPLAPAAGGRAGGGVLAAPELATACRVSLGIGMFAMLLTM
jgi:Domain of unknown function (DUF5134)